MHSSTEAPPCNCLALRQATRHITRFYDQKLADTGLRSTQYSILARLERLGATTINALATSLVTDRTTLGRNLLPLQREGLVAIGRAPGDRRSKAVTLTVAGRVRHAAAKVRWGEAQDEFEATFGADRSAELRVLLGVVADLPLATGPDCELEQDA